MPERQIPNTIVSIYRVLNTASDKANSTSQDKWAVSVQTKTGLDTQLPIFKKEYRERQVAISAQIKLSKEEDILQETLRIVVSHFIQVFNFGVIRKVFSPSDKTFYGLDANQSELPPLYAEHEVRDWAEKLIAGEQDRLAQAARNNSDNRAMQNPNIGDVQKAYTDYMNAHNKQSAAKDKYKEENRDIQAMLPKLNELVRDVYDDVEYYFRKLDPPAKRAMAREWGVIYISRNGETPEEGVISEEEFNNM